MNITKIIADILDVAEKAAPLVGLGEELEAGKALVEAIGRLVDGVKDEAGPATQDALQARLDVLAERVNKHADDTATGLLG